jgi:cytochrome c-type biogenesis protein CcmH
VRRAVVLALAAALLMGAAPQASLPDIEDEVMCVECGTALNVSTSTVADQERDFIRRQIAMGKTKQEIKDALVAEFGPGVLADPPRSGFDLAAWLVPIMLVVAAAGGLAVAARRWRRRAAAAAGAGPAAATDPAGEGGPPLDDEEARRLDAELAAYDRR